MASVGLPLLATFHWYRSLGVAHRGKSRMTFRSWVRTLVVAKKQLADPVIFDKLGCKSVCLVNRYGTSGELILHLEL